MSMKLIQLIKENKGFTITEVMIALAIFSIGFLAYSSLQISATKSNTKSRWLTQAVTCATDRVEQLLDLPYAHADLAAGTHTPAEDADGIDNNSDGRIDEPSESGPLNFIWTVTDNAPVANVKTVNISITWSSPYGQNTMNLEYYKADL
ncbi:MAG: prepilin-type N-terminal cleavage/methylation domain-containing protein [Deltaproteobacteria bacterium]|nr:prepilin-type N-terminal cleavage/methylation domain-containing protein [Deltaproteobacteria bacterium]